MYDKLILLLQRELLTGKYNIELTEFWLDSLNYGKTYNDDKKNIILKVNKMYEKEKIENHSKTNFLISLISFLKDIDNYDDYSLSSLYFLGYYLFDCDKKQIEEFINKEISPKIINLITNNVDSLMEQACYLDYYQGNDSELCSDLSNYDKTGIRKKIKYRDIESFDGGDTHEIRRL